MGRVRTAYRRWTCRRRIVKPSLERGRTACARRAWGEAFAHLSALNRAAPLEPDDLERLALAAHLIGRESESTQAWERAHHEHVRRGDPLRAARCAFWIGLDFLLKRQWAPSGGWLARLCRLLLEARDDCVEQGYRITLQAFHALKDGQAEVACALFGQASQIGARHHDEDLVTFGDVGRAQALVLLGRPAEGIQLLDEAMVLVRSPGLSPIVAGLAYCAVIAQCQRLFDVRRAQEWTALLGDWCAAQPDLVPYRGQCLVHRSEILQLQGAWPEAMEEARQAGERISEDGALLWAGPAHCQVGDLHRLRGEFGEAEDAYRRSVQYGCSAQPGLALLWLARGKIAVAAATIHGVLDETRGSQHRPRFLIAAVEILLAAGEVAEARRAADQLAEFAARYNTPLLQAASAHASGAVLLAEGDPRRAGEFLRRARAEWQELRAPYEAARTSVLLGLAGRALGDQETSAIEFAAAREVFDRLGAAPDLARLRALTRPPADVRGGLTAREIQVLRLVAAGKRNREIAIELVISDHTVRRHLQNMFSKLGVSTRAAATAIALRADLIRVP